MFAAANIPMHLADWTLLAAPNASWSWGLILFLVILGLIVTLSPARRTYEIKKPKDE